MPRNVTVIEPDKPASNRRAGRKPAISKITPDQAELASEALALGMPQARVASLIGMAEATFSKMLKRDEELAGRLQAAKAQGVKSNLQIIQQHAGKSWQAAAWLLERCNGSTFAQPSAKSGPTLQVNLQNILASQAGRPRETVKTVVSGK